MEGARTAFVRDHLHAATAVGRMAAAAKAVELGYGIEADGGPSGRLGGWAITGIPAEVCEAHSTRSTRNRGCKSSPPAAGADRSLRHTRHTRPARVPQGLAGLGRVGWSRSRGAFDELVVPVGRRIERIAIDCTTLLRASRTARASRVREGCRCGSTGFDLRFALSRPVESRHAPGLVWQKVCSPCGAKYRPFCMLTMKMQLSRVDFPCVIVSGVNGPPRVKFAGSPYRPV